MTTTTPAPARSAGAGAPRGVLVGAPARASLLPPEIHRERAARRTRNRLIGLVVAVLVVAALAIGGTFAYSLYVEQQLAAARERTTELYAAQGEFGEIRQLRDGVRLATEAQRLGASTEIDWNDYLAKVQATVPDGMSITQLAIDSTTPVAEYAQATAPLQGQRVATIALTGESPVLPDVAAWLTTLSGLPGFADALPGTTEFDETSGVWRVDITMHVDDEVYSNRFADGADEEGDGE
ncbi:hypothetical protein [Agromyces seonyuensis]|uniref:Fimbrial assembly protein n=1 Tax=Agromyces seonyuensis TaxID=2662446 RepID=A0A6I4P760_9MICO|nr:hypothetical protein [Agromyces seonyuensis]MWB99594.1 hypothetical protein [Agromyces seonyuensis]